MRLLLDEMMPRALAAQLRRRGHDVAAASEREDLRSKPDEVLFEVALTESRAIVTENIDDFRRIASQAIRSDQDHPGIVLAPNEVFHRADPRTLGRMVRALDALIRADPELTNREVWLSEWG